jgi:hypothetical protein
MGSGVFSSHVLAIFPVNNHYHNYIVILEKLAV